MDDATQLNLRVNKISWTLLKAGVQQKTLVRTNARYTSSSNWHELTSRGCEVQTFLKREFNCAMKVSSQFYSHFGVCLIKSVRVRAIRSTYLVAIISAALPFRVIRNTAMVIQPGGWLTHASPHCVYVDVAMWKEALPRSMWFRMLHDV
jgi:hypothetical protein